MRRDTVDLYEWESYKSLAGWRQLFNIFVGLLGVIGMAFLFLTMMAATGGTISNGLVYFYVVLSVGAAALGTVGLWMLHHPNKWVGRLFFALLILTPVVLEFLN